MAKKRLKAQMTVTELQFDSSYYDRKMRALPYSEVRDWTVSRLRQEVQSYAGQNKIEEDAVIVRFEQVERKLGE